MYKFTSENTLEYVSLHDCIIENIYIDDQEALVLLFEHIDVLSKHPKNMTGYSMYTGSAIMKFVEYEILESIIYDTSSLKRNRRIIVEKEAKKKEIPLLKLLTDFEVLSTKELDKENDYYINRFDGITSLNYNADFGYFIIKYKKIVIEWNELIDKAWFEDK